MECNQQYFSKKDVENGLHIKFIQFLLDNFESKEYRVDLHAYHEDCGAVVVEWNRQLWDQEDEMGKFVFLTSEEHVERDED